MKIHTEGNAEFFAPDANIVSRDMPVFYNRVMSFNRDMTIMVLKNSGLTDIRAGLPLAGTGVRGIRMMLELDNLKSVEMNDLSPDAVQLIKKNLVHNKVTCTVHNVDANLFLLNSKGFDYIDIDPFGSPNSFLDASIKRISRRGILAVTATDTAPLCGTYTNVCRRKYWAEPRKCPEMHEIGLRILIRKCQLVGAQYERALIPIYSYHRHHYFRVFFRCLKGKKLADDILKQHGVHNEAGPLWLGSLWDPKLAAAVAVDDFTKMIAEEAKMTQVGFHDTHSLGGSFIPRIARLIEELESLGHAAARTHFKDTAIRSEISEKELKKVISRLRA